MKTTTRRVLSSAGALALAASLLAATGPSGAQAPTTTTLTVRIAGCDTCRVAAISTYLDDEGAVQLYNSGFRRVRDDRVGFAVPTERTHGLTLAVTAPWEGPTGHIALAALRYGSTTVGEKVSFRTAQEKRRGTACWAGTTDAEATLRLKARRVTVLGKRGPTAGLIVWTHPTAAYLPPMQSVVGGVIGTQDYVTCGAE